MIDAACSSITRYLPTQLHGVTTQKKVEYAQKNGAVSKVCMKFIAHLTRAQRTPSAATTVHALAAGRSSCLLRGRGASVQDGVAAGKGLPSPLATPFARSNAMRFLSLGVR